VREELAWMVAAAGVVPGAVAVDVACSEGLYARGLAAAGATVLAIDHSLPFLRRVVRRARAEGLDVVAVRALAQHLPVATGSVAAVVMGGSLNEIGDRGAAVAEMGRVCAPGGRVASMSLVRGRSRRGRALQKLLGPAGIEFPTEADTTALFTAAGFVELDVRRERVVVRLAGRRSGVDPTHPA
jgi:ubiquinone/menaquinone biosynthesis C-methylase UbiE